MAFRSLIIRGVNELQTTSNGSLRGISTNCYKYAAVTKNLPEPKLKTLETDKFERRSRLITVDTNEDVSIVSGVPEDHIKNRTVRIFRPAKNSMQSGTNNINYWQIEFDTRERWENPLIGWCSSGDPMSNMKVEFSSAEEAIDHCNKMKWRYILQKPNMDEPKSRSYGANFAWNKRTRVTTK